MALGGRAIAALTEVAADQLDPVGEPAAGSRQRGRGAGDDLGQVHQHPSGIRCLDQQRREQRAVATADVDDPLVW
jgi:hypothetical protein